LYDFQRDKISSTSYRYGINNGQCSNTIHTKRGIRKGGREGREWGSGEVRTELGKFLHAQLGQRRILRSIEILIEPMGKFNLETDAFHKFEFLLRNIYNKPTEEGRGRGISLTHPWIHTHINTYMERSSKM
jgi:hypothetical protein